MKRLLTLMLTACVTGCAWAGEDPGPYVPPVPPDHEPTEVPPEGRTSVVTLMKEYWSIDADEEDNLVEAIEMACATKQGFIINRDGGKRYYLCVNRLNIPTDLEEFDVEYD